MTTLKLTFIGSATLLIELQRGDDVLRLVTDPVFDRPGTSHRVSGLEAFTYTHLTEPALSADSLPPLDAVLLSHDHHKDNLDRSGRALSASASRVLTTEPGARRLRDKGLTRAEGLGPWQQTVLERGALRVRVTATPARHAPFGVSWLAGPVIGFLLEWEGQRGGGVWISGDTLWFGGLRRLAGRVGVAVLHLGAARFPSVPWLRFSMDVTDALTAVRTLSPRLVVPIHFEGWSHFTEGRSAIDAGFAHAGVPTRWLVPGEATAIDA